MRIGSVSRRTSYVVAASFGMLLAAGGAMTTRVTGQAGTGVAIDADDIGGVVTSSKGPEAGVWVIAETKDLPTKYIKIVVTDDRGRYVLPDLPKAKYDVWVRGYGLVDSPKTTLVTPGRTLNLRATLAPNARAAAQYYPAAWWYAVLEPPPESDFPGTGPKGNGIADSQRSQGEWIGNIKETNACTQCHQMGNKATREILPQLGTFKSSVEAWDHRVQVGISGAYMSSTMGRIGRPRALRVFADWSDRIAKGEIPPAAPPRPSGVERNVVVTQWEWVSPELFVHDEITTERHNPTINANGPVYGVTEMSGNYFTILDPVRHIDRKILIAPPGPNKREVTVSSPYWGDEVIWNGGGPHNPWMDSKGRVWMTAGGGCRLYDPKTDKITQITECRGGHHLQMDPNEVLWFDGGGSNSFDIKAWEAGKGKAAMTMYPVVIDTNGNGKLDAGYVDAKTAAVDPAKDKAMNYGQSYTSVPSPADGSVWTSYSVIPGGMVRLDPKTGLYEYFQVPYMHPGATKMVADAYLPHGIDVNRGTGVIWMALNSGHFAEFDRRKCKGPLNGPGSETGLHCVEGWTMHLMPGPNFKGVERSGTADAYYLNWTDWHNTSGLGNDIPMANGSNADAIHAYVNGKFVTMRVPYPMGFATRGMDGRIDDPKGGWKGRAIWTTHAGQASWHQEGGKSERPKAIKFQIRPDPLAK